MIVIDDGSFSAAESWAVLNAVGIHSSEDVTAVQMYRNPLDEVVVVVDTPSSGRFYRVGTDLQIVREVVIKPEDSGFRVHVPTTGETAYVTASDAIVLARLPNPCEAILSVFGLAKCTYIGYGIGVFNPVGGAIAGAGCSAVYRGLSWARP